MVRTETEHTARSSTPAVGSAIEPRRRKRIRRKLLDWYRDAQRDLPWRRTRDPYAIWVSEVMAQQTRIDSVLLPYARFLQRFPTVAALACAEEHEVLDQWSGLGYYRRARLLHTAARVCVARHGGEVPKGGAAFRALPGVGDYTAGAVGSIAFGQPLPAVDGNVVRVLSRVFAIERVVSAPETRRGITDLAAQLVPKRARSQARGAGAWNQALMELGALVCSPGRPRCGACPLTKECEARALGIQDALPRKAKRPAPIEVEVTVACAVSRGRLLCVRRPAKGLLAGMWGLPIAETGGKEALAAQLAVPVRAALGSWRHVFSHRVWSATIYRVGVRGLVLPPDARWVRLDEALALPFPSAFRAGIRLVSSACG